MLSYTYACRLYGILLHVLVIEGTFVIKVYRQTDLTSGQRPALNTCTLVRIYM